jgi:hypothetical protein
MMDHVERIHLKGKDSEARIECYHPTLVRLLMLREL